MQGRDALQQLALHSQLAEETTGKTTINST